MSFPAHHVGSYTGTAAAQTISDCGFKPRFIRIYNDSDNDVVFDYFSGQTAGLAVKTGAGTLTPTALSLTFLGSTPTFTGSTPVFTGDAPLFTGDAPLFTGDAPAFTGSTPAFTGSAPYAAATYEVTYDAAPGGTKVYLKYAGGQAYLACNMAADTVNKVISFSAGKLMVVHDASAATLGHELFCTDAGVLQVNNTMSGADEFIHMIGGGLLKVAHNGTPGSQSVYYDDGADERLECAFGDVANHNISSEVQGWKSVTPAGTNAQVTGTVAAVTGTVAAVTGTVAAVTGTNAQVTGTISQVTGTVTGNSGGTLGTSVSEVSSGGVTFTDRGFSLGSDTSINESGKTYRYVAMR